MKRSRFSTDLIAVMLGRSALGTPTCDLCRELNISRTTFYRWKRRFGDLLSHAHLKPADRSRRAARSAAAEAAFQAALAANPDNADAHRCLGLVLSNRGEIEAALDHLIRAVALMPDDAICRLELGRLLKRAGRTGEAIEQCSEAVRLNPEWIEAARNLGDACLAHGAFERAVERYAEILSRHSNDIVARNGFGVALYRLGRLEEAETAFRKVLTLSPNTAEAHMNLGFTLLSAGRYRQGWREYAWYHRVGNTQGENPAFMAPEWNGDALNGRTILLFAEQGLGDTIFFSRFVPLVAARAGRVLFEVQPELARLLGNLDRTVTVFPRGKKRPAYDCRCSLPDVAGKLEIEEAGDAPGPPYLHADPNEVARFRAKIGRGKRITVGLVWAGNPQFTGDRLRSPGLDAFNSLFELENVRFFSLQHGPGADQLAGHPASVRITDLCPHLTDMAQTAAAMEALDLVITSCSAPAHLAAALARPAWIVLPYAPDWRWMAGGVNTPWYPGVRLFQQDRVGDWRTVVGRLREALKKAAQQVAESTDNWELQKTGRVG